MSPARRLALHVALFAVVNAVYLVEVWPLWLWVTGIWAVGLGIHVASVVGARPGSLLRAGPDE